MDTTTTTEAVAGWLKEAGFEPAAGRNAEANLILHRRGQAGRLCVAIQSLRDTRLEDLVGRLAIAVLRSKKACARKGDVPAAIVHLPRWSRKAEAEANGFMSKYAPDSAWGIASADGGGVLSWPGKGEIVRNQPAETANRVSRRRDAVDLFSDANRLMLKILLLCDTPPAFWGGPRGTVQNALELGRLAGVSSEAAYRLVRTLETESFLEAGARQLSIVRRDALIARWLDREKLTRPVIWHARWMYGKPKSAGEVFGNTAKSGYAVAGFNACELLGVLHATPPGLLEVHIAMSLNDALLSWRLEQVEPADAHIALRPARYRRSILGGRVQRNGVFVVDVLQAALDVAASPARGTEQAAYIIDNILGSGGGA